MDFKKSFVLLLFFGLSSFINLHAQNRVFFYVGTFAGSGAEGLYLCTFDTLTGSMELVDTFKDLENPNYLVKSKDGKYLYVCLRPKQKTGSDTGAVASYRINQENGDIAFINEKSSGGVDPCYVDVTPDGKFVGVTNYGSGTIALYKADADGSLSKQIQVIQHKGIGPNQERQKGPHAHSIRFSPFSNLVFAADLGIDKLKIYQFEESKGELVPNPVPFAGLKPGSGPRHFDFSHDGKFIYVVNELGSTVSVIDAGNKFRIIQDIKTLPGNYKGENFCADIHISKDGRFLYCSNRGHNSITTFRIKNDGTIKRIATTSTEGNWPRNFTFSPSSNFMLVANQNSNNITVFTIDEKSGLPVFTGKELKIPTPVCLVF